MLKLMKNLEMILFVFLVIYRPALIPGIQITDITLIWSFVGYVIINRGHIYKFHFISCVKEKRICILLAISFCYATTVTFFATGQNMYGMIYIKMILYPVIYSSYIISSAKEDNILMSVLKWMGNASLIQTFFVVAMLINSSFKSSIINMLLQNGALGITAERVNIYSQRTFGLADGYFSGFGVVSGLLASIFLYVAIEKDRKFWKYIPGLLLASVVNARTGFVIFITCSIFIFIFSHRIELHRKIKAAVFLSLLIVVGIQLLGILQRYAPDTVNWIYGMFDHIEMATSISETEYTYYKLNPMNWIFPDFISSVFGTGKSYFGSEGLKNFGSSSDSGYLNMIYRGGVILSVLLYSLISYLCVDKRFKKIDLTYQIGLMCLLALAIQHYKGGVFYFNEYTTLIVMVMHISYVMYTKQERMDKIAEN